MTDIKTWVQRIEGEAAPDLWDQVLRRAPRSDAVPWSDGAASPARGWRKAAVIATAAVLSIGAIGFLALALRTAPAPQVDSVPEVAIPEVPRWTFAPAQGWEVAETPLRPAPVVLFAWTASVPFDDRDLNSYPDLTGFPLYTLRSLPADGIVLTVHQYNPVAATPEPLGDISNIPRMTLPLNLDDAEVRRPVAEEPGRPMTVYDIDAVIDGDVVNVTAYIGTNDPSQVALANAQDALTRLTRTRGSGSSEFSPGELVFTQGAESMQTLTLPDGTITPAPGGDVETRALEVSPDGRHVAYAIGLGPYQGELRVLDLQTGKSKTIVAHEGTIMSPTWTDMGARIAFIAESYKEDPSIPSFRIGYVRPDGTGMAFVHEPATGAFAVAVSPDGSRFVYIDTRSDVQMFDRGTGDTSMLWSRKESGAADSMALSPTGDQLALAADGVLYLLPIDRPGAVQAVDTDLGIFEAAWMPEGEALILSAEKSPDDDADLYLLDLSTGGVTALPSTQDDDLAPSVAKSSQ